MIGYYIRLALKSFGRNPGLTALMACAIALGIAVSVVTITVYHAMSGDPLWWKSSRLYAVTMDSWDPNKPFDPKHPELPPPELSYRDAVALFRSNIPERKAIMFTEGGVLSGSSGPGARSTPRPVNARVTTSDFFSLFDVPFLYGSGWSAAADRKAEPVVVLSREMNDELFGGQNSVGRTLRWNDVPLRVIGVLDRWGPVPKFYDLNTGAFDPPEDVYLPFGWLTALPELPSGDIECWNHLFDFSLSTFREFLNSDCLWQQMWVELPTRSSRMRMQSFIDAYWAEQHAGGRFARPRNDRLTDVDDWLADHNVVPDDNRMLVVVSLSFLAVCLINTVGILLAKFLGRGGITGIRRALGASRGEIFMQHLVEVGVLTAFGALLGLGIAFLGLLGVHVLYADPNRALTHFDHASVLWALALTVASAILAGVYPAWRIGRLAPAWHLKTQ
ncbi:MAG: ABC transporter permease [Steroidobacteraceae bacterium]